MKKIKIAFFVAGLAGGVGSVILNYFDFMPLQDYEVHIITQDIKSQKYIEMYEKRGFKVIKIPSKRESIMHNISCIIKIIKNNHYDIVHSHMTLTNFFPLLIAMVFGVKIRISHSHMAETHTLKTRILAWMSKIVATDYFACGMDAGKFLFGKNRFIVLKNAIDLDKYVFDEGIRKVERKELGANSETLIIGHVGRFAKQKNHDFIIDIFEKINSINSNTMLVLIGTGELMGEIREKVSSLGLEEKVFFLGLIDDVYKKLQAFDLFLLPSLYEGLCIAAIEAQATGVSCLFSDKVSNETKKNSNVDFLPLDYSIDRWVERCYELAKIGRRDCRKLLEEEGYDIKKEALKLDQFYKEKVKNNKAGGR